MIRGDDQLEDDEMALDDNEMTLKQPESESALSSKVDVRRGRSQNWLCFSLSL